MNKILTIAKEVSEIIITACSAAIVFQSPNIYAIFGYLILLAGNWFAFNFSEIRDNLPTEDDYNYKPKTFWEKWFWVDTSIFGFLYWYKKMGKAYLLFTFGLTWFL